MEAMGNRKGILKSIIKQLHQGAGIEEIREKAKEVLKELSPAEIAEVEQELIKEGIPREEIRKLCDVHLEVFREGIEKEKISVPEWHPLHILMEEHKILLKHAKELQESAKEKNTEKIKKIVGHMKEAEKHYLREENILFSYLEKHGITEPPAIMWTEHDKIREIKKSIYEMVNEEKFEELENLAFSLHELLSSHFYKENKVLFPTALKVMEQNEWIEARRQFDEVGYCCFMPEKMLIEAIEEKKAEGEIQFETGNMSKKELEAMLNALPVDITFIDKNDEVRYFNQSKDRIFVRTKAIIGRKVQNCHPQRSVHIVNKILEEFKKGSKDKAEFWIDMNGRKIYIRYFPVRKNGEYIGTIEVTQDITDVKKIKGEKKLLDWK
ncbi:MAG: DUF438 domain-containing protein [Thermoplasmata archaeon]|nr:MAG: DUF438 domain-containing protein [Thermoplasmata archaeon]